MHTRINYSSSSGSRERPNASWVHQLLTCLPLATHTILPCLRIPRPNTLLRQIVVHLKCDKYNYTLYITISKHNTCLKQVQSRTLLLIKIWRFHGNSLQTSSSSSLLTAHLQLRRKQADVSSVHQLLVCLPLANKVSIQFKRFWPHSIDHSSFINSWRLEKFGLIISSSSALGLFTLS